MTRAREPIADGDHLLRRVPCDPNLWQTDEAGTIRVSSAAFTPSSGDAGVSVGVRRLLPDPKRPGSMLAAHPTHGLIELTAKGPRALGLDVVHAPLVGAYEHANIVGFPEGKSARKRLQRELARGQYVWVRHPDGPT